MEPLKIAIIGLDTSHSVALPGLMQDPKEKDIYQYGVPRLVEILLEAL